MEVLAKLKGARLSAQKARLVADQIRGKGVEEALLVLTYSSKKGAAIIKKVLNSAIASAATTANLVAPKSDAPRQVLPQTWRHAAGFGISHLESKLHPTSAAGRRNCALVPIRAR